MFRAGYTGASVRDICEAAEVPLGSFTNHFRSKEAFSEEVLDRYFVHLKGFVKEALDDKPLTPRHQLNRYLAITIAELPDAKCLRDAPFGEFSLKTHSQTNPLPPSPRP